jgi:hypothetical protein
VATVMTMSPLWTTTSGASSAAGATRSADTRLHPLRQSLVLTVSGVVINADTPSETVIALPPNSRSPPEGPLLANIAREVWVTSPTRVNRAAQSAPRALDDAATAFDEITRFR